MTTIPFDMRRTVMFACVAVAAALAGCSKGPAKMAPQEGTNLNRLVSIYSLYAQQHNNIGPPNESELIKFAKTLDPEGMKIVGVDVTQVEQYFKSSRDGMPYRVIYKVQSGDPTNPPVIAYEQTGVGGKREVGFFSGRVEEVDEARFRQLVPAR